MADEKDNKPPSEFRDSNYNNPEAPLSFGDRVKGAVRSAVDERIVANFGTFGRMYEAKRQGNPTSLREAFKAQIASQVGMNGNIGSAIAASMSNQYSASMFGIPNEVIRVIDLKVSALDAKLSQKIERVQNQLESEVSERKRAVQSVQREVEKIHQQVDRIQADFVRFRQNNGSNNPDAEATVLNNHNAVQSIVSKGHDRMLQNAPFLRSSLRLGKILTNGVLAKADPQTKPKTETKLETTTQKLVKSASQGAAQVAVSAAMPYVAGAAVVGAAGYGAYRWWNKEKAPSESGDVVKAKPLTNDKSTADLTRIETDKSISISSAENISITSKKDITIKARELKIDAVKVTVNGRQLGELGTGMMDGGRSSAPQPMGPTNGQTITQGGITTPVDNERLKFGLPPQYGNRSNTGGMNTGGNDDTSGGVTRPSSRPSNGSTNSDTPTPSPQPTRIMGETPSPQSTPKGFMPDDKPQATQGGSGFLAEQRARYVEELEKDPALKNKMLAAMMAENNKHPAGPMESLFNRAAAEGKTLKQMLTPSFYGPMARGEVPDRLRPGSKEEKAAMAAFDRVKGGSNDIDLRTDQGLVNEHRWADSVAGQGRGRKEKIQGEYYSDKSPKHESWAGRTRKEMLEWEAKQNQSGNSGGAGGWSDLGPMARAGRDAQKYDPNVVPNYNMRAEGWSDLPPFAAAALGMRDKTINYDQRRSEGSRDVSYYYQLKQNPNESMMQNVIGKGDAAQYRFGYDPEANEKVGDTYAAAKKTGAGLLLYDQGIGAPNWSTDTAQRKKYGDNWMQDRLFKNIRSANEAGIAGDRLHIEIDNTDQAKGRQVQLYKNAIDGMREQGLTGRFILKNPSGLSEDELKEYKGLLKDKNYAPYLAGVGMQELEGYTSEDAAKVKRGLGNFPTIVSADTQNYGTQRRKGEGFAAQTVRVDGSDDVFSSSREKVNFPSSEARIDQEAQASIGRRSTVPPSMAVGHIGGYQNMDDELKWMRRQNLGYNAVFDGNRWVDTAGPEYYTNHTGGRLDGERVNPNSRSFAHIGKWNEDKHGKVLMDNFPRWLAQNGLTVDQVTTHAELINKGAGSGGNGDKERLSYDGGRGEGALMADFIRRNKDEIEKRRLSFLTQQSKGQDIKPVEVDRNGQPVVPPGKTPREMMIERYKRETQKPATGLMGNETQDFSAWRKSVEMRESRDQADPSRDIQPPTPEPMPDPQKKDVPPDTVPPPRDTPMSDKDSTIIEKPVNNPEKEKESPSSDGYGQTQEFD